MIRRWQFWVGVAISALFLFFAFRGVDWAAAWQAVRTARWPWLLPAWACLLASYVARAWRWRSLLVSFQPVSWPLTWQATMVGLVSNNVLPARIGELVRAFILGQKTNINAALALGTIAVERTFDVLMTCLLLVFGITWSVLGDTGYSLWVGMAAVGGVIAGVLTMALWGERLIDRGERLIAHFSPTWAGRLSAPARLFVRGLRVAGRPRQFFGLAIWTMVVWGTFMGYGGFILRALGMSISLAGLAFLFGVAGLGIAIPSAPGSVGTLEYAYVFGLDMLQLGDSSTRISFALIYHALEWATTLGLGLICLGQLGMSLGQISRAAETDLAGSRAQ